MPQHGVSMGDLAAKMRIDGPAIEKRRIQEAIKREVIKIKQAENVPIGEMKLGVNHAKKVESFKSNLKSLLEQEAALFADKKGIPGRDIAPTTYVGPQKGPQTEFLKSSADIAIYGGAAGGGKSFSLLLDPLRYIHDKNFGAVLFRRTYKEIKSEGGLWDEATNLYLPLGAKPREYDLSFRFPSGAKITFAHLQHEKDVFSWQGSQIPYVGFDELTHFTPRMFWYLQSRMRNVSGIPTLMRGTCNPDPDSFVRVLIDWWIDAEGFSIPERSGIIKWFVRVDDDLKWGNSAEELLERWPNLIPRSFTFIASKLADNQILAVRDPQYLANLLSLPMIERKRLLEGNWNVRPAAGLYFKRQWFEVVPPAAVPPLMKVTRGWDIAGTSKEDEASKKHGGSIPAATAGVKMGKDYNQNIYILDVKYDKVSPLQVERMIVNCAKQDGKECVIRLPQDPGQAGKFQIAHFSKLLLGWNYHTRVMTGDKVTRAGALSSAAEHGRIKVVEGPWNDTFFNHAEQFPPEFGSPDIIDAAVEAFQELTSGGRNVKSIAPVSILI